MLLSQYLSRCHDARLIAIAKSNEHGHKGYKRLARTYIALQQTVHLATRTHIVAYLVHHTFLCTGEFELEIVGIEVVELLPYFVQYVATILATMVAGVAQNVELNVEQLFKLESFARLLHVHSVARIVNATHGLIARHKMQTLHDKGRQCFGQWRGYLLKHRLDQTFYVARRHARLLHPLGGDIVGLHAHLRELQIFSKVDVGMCYLIASAEYRRSSEDYILHTHLIILVYVLRTREPYEIHHAVVVGEVCHDTLLARSHLKLLKRQDVSLYLHEGHVARQLADGIYATAVDIFVRIILQQATPGAHLEFLLQQLLALRPYTGQIHYVL